MNRMLVTAAIVSVATAGLPALGQDDAAAPAKDARQGDPYLLDVCPVSKEKLGSMGEPVVQIHEGRELRLCCKGCVKDLAADPAAVLKAADDLTIESQRPYYPVTVCVVSDEPLEEPVDVVSMNRLVRLCCKGCKKDFNADPKAFIKKLDKAVVARQRERYPLTTCPVSGETLDAEAVEMVYGNRLVRFCCNRCVRSFEKSPTAHVAALDKAWAAQPGGAAGAQGAAGQHGAHGEQGQSGQRDEQGQHGEKGAHGGRAGGG